MPEKNDQKTYYLNGCTIVIGAEIFSTGGTSDFIKVKYREPRNTYTETSNGGSQRSRHDSDAADIEVHFMKMDRRIDAALHAQADAVPPFDESFFQVIDPRKGVVLTATQMTVAERPERNWGKEGGEQMYKLHSPNVKTDFSPI